MENILRLCFAVAKQIRYGDSAQLNKRSSRGSVDPCGCIDIRCIQPAMSLVEGGEQGKGLGTFHARGCGTVKDMEEHN